MSLFDDDTASLLLDAKQKSEMFERKRIKIEERRLDIEQQRLASEMDGYKQKQDKSNYTLNMVEVYKKLKTQHAMTDERILELFPDMKRLNIIKEAEIELCDSDKDSSD